MSCPDRQCPLLGQPEVAFPNPDSASFEGDDQSLSTTHLSEDGKTQNMVPRPAAETTYHKSSEERRFWTEYANNAYHYDKARMTFWARRFDLQLIFAGIFSAIIMPFIAETYDLLLSDPMPSACAIRVNACLSIALVICIVTAVFCLHGKQWLDAYDVDLLKRNQNASLEDLKKACRTRQYRYRAYNQYSMPRILGFGAFFLYMSLICFCIALIDFFWHLYRPIGIILALISTTFLSVHVVLSVQPCLSPDSPFKTPLSYILSNLWRGALSGRFKVSGIVEEWEEQDIASSEVTLDDQIRIWSSSGGNPMLWV